VGSALLCSLVLRDPPRLLSLIAGVAVCDAVGGQARLKWPNDVVIEPELAKLAGILVEGRPQTGWAVLGVGVNVAVRVEQLPAELRRRAASLELPSNAIEPIMDWFVRALERRLAEPVESVLDAWRERDALRGRAIAWAQGHGLAEGIDEDGNLLVRLEDGARTRLAAGEVHLESVG
jgi:BirA family biotin operon repressor/biotin-[acetyl-CoA-carboxylase] ligase